MARLSYDSDSEDDEFPALQTVATRVRQQKLAAARAEPTTTDKENVPSTDSKPVVKRIGRPKASASATGATPLRRRKLGDTQAFDNPLFRKWSGDGTESRSRTSRVSSREVGLDATTVSELPAQDTSKDSLQSEDSDEDVFVRRRRQHPQPPAQKPRRSRAESRVKTEAVVSVIEFDDESRTVEETLEISAIFSDGPVESSEDDESEFVTALSVGVDSDFKEEPQSQLELKPTARRTRSPSAQRMTNVRLPPPKHIPNRKAPVRKISTQEERKIEGPGDAPIRPSTPQKGRSRDVLDVASGLEDDFDKLKLYADGLNDSPEAKLPTQLDPVTPRKRLSPVKAPRIPPSPWKAEHKEFWDVEVQNEWIDRHSPPKRGLKKLDLTAGAGQKEAMKQKYSTSPEKRDAKKAFDQVKEKLAQDFLDELDERITSGELSRLTAAVGGLRIKWSASLHTTAGRAHWKCKEVTTKVQQADGSFKSTKERQHDGWIELATKVLTKEDDLLNTVAHEFCHLAVFMLDGKPKSAHGVEFKTWGRKCMESFKSRGIEVTTKHNYEIDFKFIWRCMDCTSEIKRHSKSVNPEKQRCGRCRGVLEQVKPVPRPAAKGKGKSTYQEFVSQEMKALKAEGKAQSFKEMMAEVSKRWKVHQQGNKATSTVEDIQSLGKEFEELVVTDLVSD